MDGQAYSEDLGSGSLLAVVNGGSSCNEAAKQFDVAVCTAIGWVHRQRETSSVAPGKMGGHSYSGSEALWKITSSILCSDMIMICQPADFYKPRALIIPSLTLTAVVPSLYRRI